MSWAELDDWWMAETAADATYRADIDPILVDTLKAGVSSVYLDVGCGDGRIAKQIRASGPSVVGVDLVRSLLKRVGAGIPVVRLALPSLSCFKGSIFDGAYACLVLEHIAETSKFFSELSRVVRAGGQLVLILNHPVFTAPGSAPIQDTDGEVLWRPGEYFSRGYTDEPAGDGTVRFHHRTTGELLTAAADAGWSLEELREFGTLPTQVEQSPALAEQAHIPRILAVRWRLR